MTTIHYTVFVIFLLVGLISFLETAESKELFPLTDFYDTPESFAADGKPGDLIRSEKFDGYVIPQGAKATRILYGSKDSQGGLVVSSGVVLVPPGEPPEGGWPVIAWAHGTSGAGRTCAPSLTAECFANYRVLNTLSREVQCEQHITWPTAWPMGSVLAWATGGKGSNASSSRVICGS